MKSGETVNIDGYELSYDLFRQACNIKLEKQTKKFSGDCLIEQIFRGEDKIRKDLEDFSKTYPKSTLINAPEYPFWKEIKVFYSKAPHLYNLTMEWLESLDK
jgi:hypothetical protein